MGYTERNITREITERYSDYDRFNLMLAQHFVNVRFDKLDDAIKNAMQLVAEFCHADRAVIYAYDQDSEIAVLLYEWAVKPEYSVGNCMKTYNLPDMRMCPHHAVGSVLYRNCLQRLPEGSLFAHLLSASDIDSLCSCPIIPDGRMTGITVFATAETNKTWSETELSVISIFSNVITNILIRKDRESALNEFNRNNQIILDSINEGVGMFDIKGKILHVNRHLAEIFNRRKEDCIGFNIREILPEEKYPQLYIRLQESLLETLDANSSIIDEVAMDGRWYSNRFYPVYKDGTIVAVTLCATDITNTKTAEAEAQRFAILEKEAELLRRNESDYLEIIDGSTEATWIKDLVRGTYEFSKQWLKRIGEGIPPEDMDAYILGLIHPEDAGRLKDETRLICENKPAKYKSEYRLKIADGSYIWVMDKGKLIYDEKGNIIKIFGTCTDITEQKKSEAYINILYETTGRILSSLSPREEITELCLKVMNFLDCHVFFNYLVEDEKPALRLNACGGIPEEQKPLLDYLPLGTAVCGCAVRDSCRIITENIQTTEDPRTQFIKAMGIRAYVCHPLIADGKTIGGLAFGTKSRDTFRNEELLLMKTVAESVSVAIKRKQNEETLLRQAEELIAADQNKNEFLSTLSHELRNPLATISAGLSLLDISNDKAHIEKAKGIMRRQMEHLCHLVDDLLDITRITRNKIILKKEKFELTTLALSAADDLNTLFEEKGVTLVRDISPIPISLSADPVRIKQIIGNLLHNALKFTSDGCEVTLSVYAEEDCVIIKVKDNGIGIEPEFMPNLFEPFMQADKSIDRRNSGLGLGLFIVKGIAELHGGSVRAHSDGPDRGSEFLVCIPVC